MVDFDIYLQRARFLCSNRQFIWALSDCHLLASFSNFRPSYFQCSSALVQVSNFQGALILNSYESTQAVRETFSALLTQVLHNILQEAVSIFLLIRQQLQRIDQICAKALRYCMCFEYLSMINIISCLCDQKPVRLLPIVFLSTYRTPPSCMLFLH